MPRVLKSSDTRLAGHRAGANLDFGPAAVVRVVLYQLGEIVVGKAVKDATLDLLRRGVRTGDLGGNESTETFTAAVAVAVAEEVAP